MAAENELADRIRAAHASFADASRRTLKYALTLGDLLIEAKSKARHGSWLLWLKRECPAITDRHARNFMTLAKNRALVETKSEIISDLTIERALSLIRCGESRFAHAASPDAVNARAERTGGGWVIHGPQGKAEVIPLKSPDERAFELFHEWNQSLRRMGPVERLRYFEKLWSECLTPDERRSLVDFVQEKLQKRRRYRSRAGFPWDRSSDIPAARASLPRPYFGQ